MAYRNTGSKWTFLYWAPLAGRDEPTTVEMRHRCWSIRHLMKYKWACHNIGGLYWGRPGISRPVCVRGIGWELYNTYVYLLEVLVRI